MCINLGIAVEARSCILLIHSPAVRRKEIIVITIVESKDIAPFSSISKPAHLLGPILRKRQNWQKSK
jgi:hypothetical protein